MNGGLDELPSSPILCGWLRRLSPFKAQTLRLVRFPVIHLECLVRSRSVVALATLERLFLHAVQTDPTANAPTIASRFGVPVPLAQAVWHTLSLAGLLGQQSNGRVALSEAGSLALGRGEYALPQFSRAGFVFARVGGHSPASVFLTQSPAAMLYAEPTDPPHDWRVDADLVREYLERPDDWKRQAGFPTEIEAVVTLGQDCPLVPDWQRAVIAYPRLLTAAVFDVPSGKRGYVVMPGGWHLYSEPVAFELSHATAEQLPGLAHPLAVELWQESAKRWCANEGVPCDDVQVDVSGPGLRLSVPPAVRQRLQPLVGLGHWLWANDPIGYEARLVEWEPSQLA
jgi:hypothetical protein